MRRPKNTKWPCIFRGKFVREQIDPRVQAAWIERTGGPAPFGDLRKLFRNHHCSAINPYGSESCPYAEEDCGLAFLQTVEETLRRAEGPPAPYFREVAHSRGLTRAENKPLARDRIVRTDGHSQGASGLRSGPGSGSGDVLGVPQGGGPSAQPAVQHLPPRVADAGTLGVHGTGHRLQSMGSLLRGDGAGSCTQPYRRHEGEASTDIDGDTRDPVSPPPPGRLGDQPPSGDPDLHQGGE